MSIKTRRFAPTIVAALTVAAIVLPTSALAIEAPLPQMLTVEGAQARAENAEQALTNRRSRIVELQTDVAVIDARIAIAEKLQPTDPVDVARQLVKVYLSPLYAPFRVETEMTVTASMQLPALREAREDVLAELEVLAESEETLAEDARLTAEALTQARAAEAARIEAARVAERAALMAEYGAFPVAGPNDYIDSWGFARSGGRSHKGADIMAKAGTPVVAVKAGVVKAGSNRLGGTVIWLTAEDGTRYYYAHLQSVEVKSGAVEAGQVIGKVGSSGNASASAPHLHIEIHKPNAVDPYPYLRKMVV